MHMTDCYVYRERCDTVVARLHLDGLTSLNMRRDIEQQIMIAKQCMGCMHEGVIVTALDGTIVESSPAAERILERPSTGLKGKQVREICPIVDAYDELIR